MFVLFASEYVLDFILLPANTTWKFLLIIDKQREESYIMCSALSLWTSNELKPLKNELMTNENEKLFLFCFAWTWIIWFMNLQVWYRRPVYWIAYARNCFSLCSIYTLIVFRSCRFLYAGYFRLRTAFCARFPLIKSSLISADFKIGSYIKW